MSISYIVIIDNKYKLHFDSTKMSYYKKINNIVDEFSTHVCHNEFDQERHIFLVLEGIKNKFTKGTIAEIICIHDNTNIPKIMNRYILDENEWVKYI